MFWRLIGIVIAAPQKLIDWSLLIDVQVNNSKYSIEAILDFF